MKLKPQLTVMVIILTVLFIAPTNVHADAVSDWNLIAVQRIGAAPGIPQSRTYSRFSDAADDVVNARIYEGIHFRFADEDAFKQGRHVAQWAHGHFLKPLDE